MTQLFTKALQQTLPPSDSGLAAGAQGTRGPRPLWGGPGCIPPPTRAAEPPEMLSSRRQGPGFTVEGEAGCCPVQNGGRAGWGWALAAQPGRRSRAEGPGTPGRGMADGGDGLWGGAAPSHDGLVRQPVEDQVEGDGEPLRALRLRPEEHQPVLPGLQSLICGESRRACETRGSRGQDACGPTKAHGACGEHSRGEGAAGPAAGRSPDRDAGRGGSSQRPALAHPSHLHSLICALAPRAFVVRQLPPGHPWTM